MNYAFPFFDGLFFLSVVAVLISDREKVLFISD